MTQIIDELNNIGTVLYNDEDNEITLFEVDSVFKLRKAKIKHKGWLQSKIYSSNENRYIIYIEKLDKWYYNNQLFQEKDITVELFDSIDDINMNSCEISTDEENTTPEDLILSGYLVYNIINYNYMNSKCYQSRLQLEKDLNPERPGHIEEVYKKEGYNNVYYINNLGKWYYNSKPYYSNFRDIKLYDNFEDIPISDLEKKDFNNIFHQTDENREFRGENIKRLNKNALHKDLSRLGYILYEFTSINHIKFRLFNSYNEAEQFLTEYNQISKCYHKHNNKNILYIKQLNRWINKEEKNTKIYQTDIDIPMKKEEKSPTIENNENNTLKNIVKRRKLVPKGWIYYTIIDEENIAARHYTSSNKLLNRLKEGGYESQYYETKTQKICYIPKINKWYNYSEELETKDVKIKIYDEKEIFEEAL